MFAIKEFSVQNMKDPFNILTGERFEFILELDIDEDDELHTEEGVSLRVIYLVDEGSSRIVKYEFLNRSSNQYIDVEMEEDEQQLVDAFCREKLEVPAAN